jgi:hypothetical protein
MGLDCIPLPLTEGLYATGQAAISDRSTCFVFVFVFFSGEEGRTVAELDRGQISLDYVPLLGTSSSWRPKRVILGR